MSPILQSIANGSARGYGAFFGAGAAGAFESIASATGTGSNTTITFSNIPSTYQHLQLRIISRQSSGALTNSAWVLLKFNNDTTAANYTLHGLLGTGSAVQGNWGFTDNGAINTFYTVGNSGLADTYGVGIIDIHDYASTTKNKTVRNIGGNDQNGNGNIFLTSGLWINTSAINRIDITGSQSNTWASGSTFALYGIKGA